MATAALAPQTFQLECLETTNMAAKSHCPGQGPRQRAKSQRCAMSFCSEAVSAPGQPRAGSCGPRWSGGRAAAARTRSSAARGLSRDKKRGAPGVRRVPPGSTLGGALKDLYGIAESAEGQAQAAATHDPQQPENESAPPPAAEQEAAQHPEQEPRLPAEEEEEAEEPAVARLDDSCAGSEQAPLSPDASSSEQIVLDDDLEEEADTLDGADGSSEDETFCASQFITNLLEDAVDEFTDDSIREVIYANDAMAVLREDENEDCEFIDHEDILTDSQAGVCAAAMQDIIAVSQAETEFEDYPEETLSVVSCTGDQGFDLEEEEALAAEALAKFIVNTPFSYKAFGPPAPAFSQEESSVAAATTGQEETEDIQKLLMEAQEAQERLAEAEAEMEALEKVAESLLPSAGELEPCARRAFRRRLAPRSTGAPVPEEPFPGDCLPPSPPVAREAPPSAELAALPSPLCEGQAQAQQPLSAEAEERLTSIAAAAFAALRLTASEEASMTIQRQWRECQARQATARAKAVVATALAAQRGPAAAEATATVFRMDAADPPVSTAARESSLAKGYESLGAAEFHSLDEALHAPPQTPRTGSANPRRRMRPAATGPAALPAGSAAPPQGLEAAAAPTPPPVAAGLEIAPRPPTAPPTPRPFRSTSRPTGSAHTSGNAAPSLMLPVPTPREEVAAAGAPPPPGVPATPRMPAKLQAPPATAPSGPVRCSPRPHAMAGVKAGVDSSEGGKTPRSARHYSKTSKPVVPEAPKTARAPVAPAPPDAGAIGSIGFGEGIGLEPVVPPARARTSVAGAAGGAFRRRPMIPGSSVTGGEAAMGGGAQKPAPTAAPSAMELDLGFGPAAPSPRTAALLVPESPRSKACGTGLLPALYNKAAKTTVGGSANWTVGHGGSFSARASSLTAAHGGTLSARSGSLSARTAKRSVHGAAPLF